MISDAYVRVTCDTCTDYTDEINLTALAHRNSYDMRNVARTLEREGWTKRDGKDVCPNCFEYGEGEPE